jgi:hypothetical protein
MICFIASWLIIGLLSAMGLLIIDDADCTPGSFRLLVMGMLVGYITFLVFLKDVYSAWRRYC